MTSDSDLQLAGDADEFRTHDDRPEPLEISLPDDDVGDGLLVLQRQEDRISLAWPLPHQNQPGHRNAPAVRAPMSAGIRRDAGPVEPLAQEGDRMRLQRKAERAVVVDDMLAERHRPAALFPARCRAGGFRADRTAAAFRRRFCRRARAPPIAPSRRSRPSERKASASASFSISSTSRPERSQTSRTESIAVAAPGDECFHALFRQALDLAKAEPDGMAGLDDVAHSRHGVRGDPAGIEGRFLQRAVPVGMIDVDRPDLDAMVAARRGQAAPARKTPSAANSGSRRRRRRDKRS